MALLALVVVGVLHASGLEARLTKNQGDATQAYYLALAGVEKAKALLYHDARERRGSRVNHSGHLYDNPEEFKDVPLGRGVFRVLRQGVGPREVAYGVVDEESRLNVNLIEEEVLQKITDFTSDIAAALLDYRDGDDTTREGGAEAEAYAALQPPYLPRNGPFLTLRELLMVRGMPRKLFLGEDANLNGLLDPAEDDGEAEWPDDNQDGVLDAGWSGWLTVNSEVRLVDAAGEAQVHIQEGAEEDLANVPGIGVDVAKAIVAYRQQQQLESLADLLEVTAPRPENAPQPPPPSQGQPQPQAAPGPPRSGPSPAAAPSASASPSPSGSQPPRSASGAPVAGGQPLISEQLLKDIADQLTIHDGTRQPGPVNINTAGVDVLACLPGVDRTLAQAIISHRASSGFFSNIAYLLEVPNLTREIFKQVAPHVTTRSETFRILAEGEVSSSRARKRIAVTVRIGTTYVDTLSFREDDL